jgi:GGDEF domain-containing protein
LFSGPLLDDLHNGERDAFVRFFELFRLPVHDLVSRLMRGHGDAAAQLATLKVKKAIARHNAQPGGAVQLSASVGMHTVSGLDTDDLLREAGRRMHAAKETRRNGSRAAAPAVSAAPSGRGGDIGQA